MATERDLLSMLHDAGAVKLPTPNNHLKYKLPNGKLFVTSSTPSDHRSYNNAVAMLRRELRITHPDIANRGRNLPRNRRTTTNTIGDVIALKMVPAGFSEAEVQVLSAPPEPIFEPETQPEPVVYRPPRIRRDPQPSPAAAKTLTPEQLNEANHILRRDGEAAMNAYLNQHRQELVTCSTPAKPTPTAAPFALEDQMQSILERAEEELRLTNERIAGYDAQLATIKKQQEDDILKQAQLEQYIEKHRALANEAVSILQVLPPLPKIVEHPKASKPKRRSSNQSTFTLQDVRELVYPALRSRQIEEFGNYEFMETLNRLGLTGHWSNMLAWLISDSKRKHNRQIEKSAPGRFRFIQEN